MGRAGGKRAAVFEQTVIKMGGTSSTLDTEGKQMVAKKVEAYVWEEG